MDIKKAIEHYNYGISHDIFSEPVTSYAKMAVDALEKQLAKKPIENKHNGLQADYVLYACPNCKQEFQLLEDITGTCNQQEKPFYCPECGQKIDWD